MVDCNINQEWAYRTKNGEPVPEVPGGPEANKYRNLAIAHDAMLSDFVESIINWVLAAAANGEQRWFYIENGLASYIWKRPAMKKLMRVFGISLQTVNYCAYQVFCNDVDQKYTSRKSTGILTNSPFVPKLCSCPNKKHRHTIGGAAGTTAPHFAGAPPTTCKHVTPAELTFDIAAATLSGAPPNMIEESTFWYPVLVESTASMVANTTQPCDFRLPGWLLDEVMDEVQ